MSDNINKYVCKVDDLNKRLDESLAMEFQQLFYDYDYNGKSTQREDAWRMFYNGLTPADFLKEYGIDFNKPTVRDAVAFDLVKLDDSSVSNDNEYTATEHINYSPYEYDRFLLNRNFRVNLVNLEKEWSDITYKDTSEKKHIRTVDRVYQGVRLSEQILCFFDTIFEKRFDGYGTMNDFDIDNLYVPFTNGLDITTEVALIPNTHIDFPAISSRSYYDIMYEEYKELLEKHGIRAISSFALVDPDKDKNHTGKYLVKVQKRFVDCYGYIIATIDKDGQIQRDDDGKLDIRTIRSKDNIILSVCESDFTRDSNNITGDDSEEKWSGVIGDIPMVHSTTSSHYSIFRQRIPGYDLKYVRNYIQFKTRLEGMELCLEQLNKDIQSKEAQCSKCFIEETFAIWNMFQAFEKSNGLMELIMEFYDTIAKYDDLSTKKNQMLLIKEDRESEIQELVTEYNALPNSKLDQKVSLGDKIHSLRLELDKNIKMSIEGLDSLMSETKYQLEQLKIKIRDKNNQMNFDLSDIDTSSEEWQEFKSNFNQNFSDGIDGKLDELKKKWDSEYVSQVESSVSNLLQDLSSSKLKLDESKTELQSELNGKITSRSDVVELEDDIIDTTNLQKLVLETEKWRGYMYNLGYELNQLKKMQVMASDATIKVRRLVHNFKERMENTESQVWDSNHKWKDGFSIDGIATSGLQDIILLYDWYACNAPQKTYQEMGFDSEKQMMQFRVNCNNTSLSLRKNQYAQLLNGEKIRLQELINDLSDKIGNRNQLEYDDKYGWEAMEEQEQDESSSSSKNKSYEYEESRQVKGYNVFSDAEKQFKDSKQYEKDSKLMKDRTISYLRKIGLIENEKGLEDLAVRSVALNYDGNIEQELNKVQYAKQELDDAISNMVKQRESLQQIIDKVDSCEKKIEELKQKNKIIFNMCVTEKNKQIRNNLLLEKLNNETTVSELSSIVKKERKEHLSDFSSLEKMRDLVDKCQCNYDNVVDNFKKNIGLTQESITQLAIRIYNKYQDEILKGEK